MSNLAYRFLHAGFLDEAKSVCEEAAKVPDHHQNVDTALATIKGALEKESEAEKKVLSIAQDCSGFYRNVGIALIAGEVTEISSTWSYEGTELSVSISGGVFSARGSVKANKSGERRVGKEGVSTCRFGWAGVN